MKKTSLKMKKQPDQSSKTVETKITKDEEATKLIITNDLTNITNDEV